MTKSYKNPAGAIRSAKRVQLPEGVTLKEVAAESHPDEPERFLAVLTLTGAAGALASIPAQLEDDHVLRLEPAAVAIAEPRIAIETFTHKGVLTHRLQLRVSDPLTGKRSARHVATVRHGHQPDPDRILSRAATLGVSEAVARDAHQKFVSYLSERAAS